MQTVVHYSERPFLLQNHSSTFCSSSISGEEAIDFLTNLIRNWHVQVYNLPSDIDNPSGFFDDTLSITHQEVDLDYEMSASAWIPCSPDAEMMHLVPIRFIDGRMSLHLVGGGRSADGVARPILAGQLGVGCLPLQDEIEVRVARVMVLNLDDVPMDYQNQVREELLKAPHQGFYLIPYRRPEEHRSIMSNFDSVHKLMYRRGRDEMLRWEKEFTEHYADEPIIVDGRVIDHISPNREALVIGVIKRRRANYLHAHGNQVIESLMPGERSPAFLINPDGQNFRPPLVSFYMRLSDEALNPTIGIIRVELRQSSFETFLNRSFDYLDTLAGYLFSLRCQRYDYARAAVTTEPIYQIEDLIGAHFLSNSVSALEAQTYLMTVLKEQ